MKTQILKLEIHDDVVSIRDKLAWKQTGRILLVFPEKRDGGLHRRLNRGLDLLLLKRAAERLGAQIAFVTQNGPIQKTATEIGIPIFRDLDDARTSRWRGVNQPKRRREAKRLPSHGQAELAQIHTRFHTKPIADDARLDTSHTRPKTYVRWIWLAAAMFLLSGLAWLCIVPHVEIRLSPRAKIQEISVPSKASSHVKTVQISGEIPARRFSVIVESRDQVKTSGMVRFANTKARGEVVFGNLTTRSIQIPAGTQLSSSANPDITFRTTSAGMLAAGFINDEEPITSITVPIEAVTPGSSSNLAAETIDTILGSLAPNLTVINPAPFVGGTEKSLPCPTTGDRRKLRERTILLLEKNALAELEKAISLTGKDTPGLLLSNHPEIARVIEETYLPVTEQTPAYTLEFDAKIEYQAWGASGDDLAEYALKSADAVLPVGFVPAAGTLEVLHTTVPQEISTVSAEDGTFEWQIRIRRKIHAGLERQVLYRRITLRSPQTGAQILEDTLSLEKPPQVTITPGWLPFLPLLPTQFDFAEDIS